MHLKKITHFCLDQIVASKQAVFGNPWTCCKETNNNSSISLTSSGGGRKGEKKKRKKEKGRIIHLSHMALFIIIRNRRAKKKKKEKVQSNNRNVNHFFSPQTQAPCRWRAFMTPLHTALWGTKASTKHYGNRWLLRIRCNKQKWMYIAATQIWHAAKVHFCSFVLWEQQQKRLLQIQVS